LAADHRTIVSLSLRPDNSFSAEYSHLFTMSCFHYNCHSSKRSYKQLYQRGCIKLLVWNHQNRRLATSAHSKHRVKITVQNKFYSSALWPSHIRIVS